MQPGDAQKQIVNHQYLNCLIHLARTNKRFHSLIAPYLFSIFAARVLLWAAKTGQRGVAEKAIRAGACLHVRNELRQTPLLLAAKHGHISIVNLLLTAADGVKVPACQVSEDITATDLPQSPSHCLDVEASDETFMTPLGEAAMRGYSSIVKLLIVHGASTMSRLQGGQTPSHLAASGGSLETVEAFLHAKGIDWNTGDMNGRSPLFLAATNGHASVVEFLTIRGARPNAPNLSGHTPLHIAAANGHKRVMELLLRLSEVDPLARDRCGYTPVDLAARNGRVLQVMTFYAHQSTLSTIGCLMIATRSRLIQFIRGLRPPRREGWKLGSD